MRANKIVPYQKKKLVLKSEIKWNYQIFKINWKNQKANGLIRSSKSIELNFWVSLVFLILFTLLLVLEHKCQGLNRLLSLFKLTSNCQRSQNEYHWVSLQRKLHYDSGKWCIHSGTSECHYWKPHSRWFKQGSLDTTFCPGGWELRYKLFNCSIGRQLTE